MGAASGKPQGWDAQEFWEYPGPAAGGIPRSEAGIVGQQLFQTPFSPFLSLFQDFFPQVFLSSSHFFPFLSLFRGFSQSFPSFLPFFPWELVTLSTKIGNELSKPHFLVNRNLCFICYARSHFPSIPHLATLSTEHKII